jgi:shikimate kinase
MSTNQHVPLELARGAWPGYIGLCNNATNRGNSAAGDGFQEPMGDIPDDNGASPLIAALMAALGTRSVVLVGMMGAGKSSIGRRLAQRLGLSFVDADAEIEAAAGMTIAEIFASYGEPYFRSGEQRVIARLLESGAQVLATGGGAYMNAETRAAIAQRGVSVWLKAEFDVLMKRVKRRATADRPMLQGDPAQRIRELMEQRYPVYAQADVTVMSREVAHESIVNEIIAALAESLGCARPSDEAAE